MARFIDLTGKKFGKLTIVRRAESEAAGKPRKWVCRCDCGNEIQCEGGNLKSGNTQSCGCLRVEKASKVKPGMKFGRMTVLTRDGSMRYGKVAMSMWSCICECGTFKSVLGMSLLNGDTRSCGCLLSDTARENGLRTIKDLGGQEFGELVVIERASTPASGTTNVKWLCACSCGGLTILAGNQLTEGIVVSCGCKKHSGKAHRKDTIRLKSRIHGARRRAAELAAYHPFNRELFELMEQEAYALAAHRGRITGI